MDVLVIDPSSSYRQLLASVLQDHGLNSIGVDGCVDAREELKNKPFSLICMAMHQPDGNSRDLCLQLRATPATAYTPILMLTATYDKKIAQYYFAAGITELFQKQDFTAFDSYLGTLEQRFKSKSKITGRLLYVEDSPSIAAMIKELLRDHGYIIDHFSSAEEGLVAFNSKLYDLVLTDVVLEGGLSGLSLVRSIRETEQSDAPIPIIAMSGFNDDTRKLELFKAGVNDYVPKPVLNEELLARIDNLVTNRQLLYQLEQQQQNLQHLAMTDQLTQLYNRHYLMDIAPKLMSGTNRRHSVFCLIVIDIDHFKMINDRFGHSQGDKVLMAIAALFKEEARLEDTVARYGGEEFIILLPGSNIKGAIKKAEMLREKIKQLNPDGISLTASFGVASQHKDETNFTHFFNRADKAVYQAKGEGRNRVVAIH